MKQNVYVALGLALTLIGVWWTLAVANISSHDKATFTAAFTFALIGMFLLGVATRITKK